MLVYIITAVITLIIIRRKRKRSKIEKRRRRRRTRTRTRIKTEEEEEEKEEIIMFTVLSSLKCHTRVHSVRLSQASDDPQTKPTDMSYESAPTLLSSTSTIAV